MKMDQKVNILLVDDRPENLLALEAVLASPEYNLVSANSGEEALKCLLKQDFAVILLDVQMPGLNGFETAKLIKDRERTRHIPIVFVTAISQASEHVFHGYSVGAIDYIFKPFHPETLKMKIEGFVKIHRYQQQIIVQKEVLKLRTHELEEANRRLESTTAELRQTEALARVIGETSIDTILTFGVDCRIITANPALTAMFGYDPADVLGEPITRFLPLPEWFRGEGEAKLVEAVATRQDGSTFPAEIQIGEASIGGQTIFVCTVRDMTERKQKTNRQIESILESITAAFCVLDNAWNFTYLNQEAERLIKRPRLNLIGASVWNVIDPASNIAEEIKRAVSTQSSTRFEIAARDGEHWYDVHAYPAENGLSIYISESTMRKRMEQDLRLSEERFRKIFDSSPSLIAIRARRDGRYIDANESWSAYTGYALEEVKGQTRNVASFRLDSDEDFVATSSPDLEESVHNVKVHYLTAKGEVRQALLSTERIELQGEPCILSVVTDITERLRFEKELAQLDRLNLIGEMAAGIAHEIRNPMTTVRGFLQLHKNVQNISHTEYIDLMVHELDRANSIITEFLTLAKNKTTHLKQQPLGGIIEKLYPLIQAEARLSDKEVTVELGDCPEVLLDEKEIRQLILNLSLNGLEAMDAGKRLILRTFFDGEEVVLEVRDQGTGIKAEILDKIATPFFTTKDKGTGMGLAVCYSVAARHQAAIDVQTSDLGTAFYVRFKQPSCHAHAPKAP